MERGVVVTFKRIPYTGVQVVKFVVGDVWTLVVGVKRAGRWFFQLFPGDGSQSGCNTREQFYSIPPRARR